MPLCFYENCDCKEAIPKIIDQCPICGQELEGLSPDLIKAHLTNAGLPYHEDKNR